MALYEELGGEDAVLAAVGGFYERVLADPSIAPFFGRLDMTAQVEKQVAFMTRAFGGAGKNVGRPLREAHQGLALEPHHCDAVAKHLNDTLVDLGIAEDLRARVLAIVEATRGEVLGG